LPQSGLVAAPAEEPEILARQPRGTVAGDQRSLDAEGTRAAQRIEKLRILRRELRPAGAQQHTRGDVLAQWRLAPRATVAASVQTVPREVDRHGDEVAVRVG